MKVSIVAAVACFAVCCMLMGCETPQAEGGQKVVREQAYAPTGTFIPRKNGTGLGGAPVETVRKQDLENQRNMGSSDQVGAVK